MQQMTIMMHKKNSATRKLADAFRESKIYKPARRIDIQEKVPMVFGPDGTAKRREYQELFASLQICLKKLHELLESESKES